MTEFRYMKGIVYIFENHEVQRVKVGMTTNSSVFNRLNDVNSMWLQRKVTCQICGGRRKTDDPELMPSHSGRYGRDCQGSHEPPLERDVSIAEKYLQRLQGPNPNQKVDTRFINSLKKRIEKYRNWPEPLGFWRLSLAFHTDCAEQVELLSHEYLEQYLDKQAPFGEVFSCDVETATGAVEKALSQLDLMNSARKEIQQRA